MAARVNRTLIGTIRRECLNHIIVFNERSLYQHLLSFIAYYDGTRTNLATAEGQSGTTSHPTTGNRPDHLDPTRLAVFTIVTNAELPEHKSMIDVRHHYG